MGDREPKFDCLFAPGLGQKREAGEAPTRSRPSLPLSPFPGAAVRAGYKKDVYSSSWWGGVRGGGWFLPSQNLLPPANSDIPGVSQKRETGGSVAWHPMAATVSAEPVLLPSEAKKVLVLGSAGSGKTALVTRFASNAFLDEYQQTFGADLLVKQISTDT
ncbi:MAG: hypothetical protein BJ554DRAFT_2693 [Olpidium bornovanus]|uniref:Uncharacterized protein n=1 Tax=Olpidium bornovanus TaxID=278681 RepID=A0A8H8DGF8_9FUNG|nr:MAG: hypothetical protein BJ554DRAFT_2693 [Olpidium bornovanus]